MILLLWIGVLTLFLIGIIGTVVPVMPGLSFVFGGILLYAFATDFETISITTMVVFGLVTTLALSADYAGSALGAKIGGGGWHSILGGFIGALLGVIFFGPIGLLLGVLFGSLAGAFTEGKSYRGAFKIAVIALLGTVGAAVFQFVLALAMIVAFLAAVFL